MGRRPFSFLPRLACISPVAMCLLALTVGACSAPTPPTPTMDTSRAADAGFLNQWRKGQDARELARTWYLTPQGSHLLDFDVFMSIPSASDQALSFSDRANLESYGFLYSDNYQEGGARGRTPEYRGPSRWRGEGHPRRGSYAAGEARSGPDTGLCRPDVCRLPHGRPAVQRRALSHPRRPVEPRLRTVHLRSERGGLEGRAGPEGDRVLLPDVGQRGRREETPRVALPRQSSGWTACATAGRCQPVERPVPAASMPSATS